MTPEVAVPPRTNFNITPDQTIRPGEELQEPGTQICWARPDMKMEDFVAALKGLEIPGDAICSLCREGKSGEEFPYTELDARYKPGDNFAGLFVYKEDHFGYHFGLYPNSLSSIGRTRVAIYETNLTTERFKHFFEATTRELLPPALEQEAKQLLEPTSR